MLSALPVYGTQEKAGCHALLLQTQLTVSACVVFCVHLDSRRSGWGAACMWSFGLGFLSLGWYPLKVLSHWRAC
jgi:hypothetical protein